MEPMTCHASGLPIPEGAAYITDKDGNTYLPEYYPDAVTGVSEYDAENPAEPEPKPEPEPSAKKAGK